MPLSVAERAAAYRARHPGRHARAQASYRARHAAELALQQLERRRSDPRKNRARCVVYRAVRAGRLERGPCEHADRECRGPVQAHHDDYDRPLVVRWLCALHHRRLHVQAA